jgi:glycosyltransferase involved in cell wall biosynthesis
MSVSQTTPKVSIWSITYNHVDYIEDCLEGILKQQTNFDFELIIGDDASTDGTSEILLDYAKKYPKIIKPIVHKTNIGVFKNSIGHILPKLKGKYVAICEGDDYWIDPLKLQKQVDYLDNNSECALCFSHQLEVNHLAKILNENKYEAKVYNTLDVVKGFIPGTQTILYRNFDCIKYWMKRHENSPSQDRMLAYFCSLLGELHLIPELMAAYRHTGKGVWSELDALEKYRTGIEAFINFHLSIGLPVNNQYIHQRVNGGLLYWLKHDLSKLPAVYKLTKQLKNKYGIKTNLLAHFFQKI